jgi:prepilin-type N-terminal cleavage/methylation domain-containing protein
MKLTHKQKHQTGFTLIELMISVAIFIAISGAIFGLLGQSQKSFRTESQLLSSFQEARLGLDQIVNDANSAGYPPLNHFDIIPLANNYTAGPLGWAPGYLTPAPCLIGTAGGGTCTTPGDFDVIFEGDVDGSGVKWIRYKLVGTTLFRGVANKTVGGDPDAATNAASGVLLPYVTNVVNNPGAARIAQFQAAYPGMFPGGVPQPIFQFTCDTPTGTVLCTDPAAGASNSPSNVRDIEVVLMVQTTERDAQTGKLRLVQLNGRGHRINPNQ